MTSIDPNSASRVSSFQSPVSSIGAESVSRKSRKQHKKARKTRKASPKLRAASVSTTPAISASDSISIPVATTPIKRLRHLLTSGNLWLYILSLVRQHGELYAYSLDEQIEQEFLFRPNKIMVYVVLYKLESEGLITSEFKERRKYYKLTKKGSETLSSARQYFRRLADKL